MPRCPLCRSVLVTITFGLYPIAFCTSCSARWIQDGHQQRAIDQVQEPSLLAHRSQPAIQPDSHTRSQRTGQLLAGGSPW
jgi:Zn-finger nucleic acid-binding protein